MSSVNRRQRRPMPLVNQDGKGTPALRRFVEQNAPAGGGGSWGGITGTLADQADLQAVLDAKLGATAPAAALVNQRSGASSFKVWTGTQTQYDALGTYDSGTQYIITDAPAAAVSWSSITSKPTTLSGFGITDAINSSLIGANSGVAPLDSSGKVPAANLPAYVDDVLEYANLGAFPGTGSSGIIYIAIDTGKVYRWTGSAYAEISPTAGNADTATKLLNARTIAMTGDVAWSVSFDGSGNVTASATISAATVTGKALTGLAAGANTAIAATDTVLAALAKLQAQVSARAASSHTHTASEITDFAESVDDRVAALLVAGSNVTITYNDVANTLTIAASGSGGTPTAIDDANSTTDITFWSGTQAQYDALGSYTAGRMYIITDAASPVDPWTYVKLASDFTTGSASAVDITGLAFTPAANTSYEFEAVLLTRTATATVGPRPGVAWPTGMTDGVVEIYQPSAAGTQVMQFGNINAAVLAPAGGLPNTTQSYKATIIGMIIAGATPSGTMKMQLASETASTNVTVKAGSYLKYRKLP